MRDLNRKFNQILEDYIEYEQDVNTVIKKIKDSDSIKFRDYLSERCEFIEHAYKKAHNENKKSPLSYLMLEDSREAFFLLLENFENKKKLKQEDDITKHIFTKLKVGLLTDRASKRNENYEIYLNINKILLKDFMDKYDERLLSRIIYPVKAEKCEFGWLKFSCEESKFKNEKDFSNFLSKKISENQLSWVTPKHSHPVIYFLQDKMIKSDIKNYGLDFIYRQEWSPILKDTGHRNSVNVDCGTVGFNIKKDHWIYEAMKGMRAVENLIQKKMLNQSSNLKQEENKTNRKKLKIG